MGGTEDAGVDARTNLGMDRPVSEIKQSDETDTSGEKY